MENQPLVSIITPSYNQAKYLPAAYQSVVTQNYPNIEYIIVDGGSTDGSDDLIRKWAASRNSRIKWWVSEKDSGQADAINKGFSRATGEIVTWLNSDDLYMKSAVEKAVSILSKDEKLGLIYSNVFSIDAESQLINVMRYGEWGLCDLMAFNIIGQPGVFMRREALAKAGFLDPDYHYLLDHHLWLRIAKYFDIRHVDDYFAAARFHLEAKNTAQAAGFSRDAFRIIDWFKTSPEFSGIFAGSRKNILAGVFRFSARYLLDGGDNFKSFKHYLKSFWYKPSSIHKEEFSRFLYSLFGFLPLAKRMKADFLQKRLNHLTQDKMDE
ncbi:MAG: glycosyltransferase, partial [Calditrichaeota bacterium]